MKALKQTLIITLLISLAGCGNEESEKQPEKQTPPPITSGNQPTPPSNPKTTPATPGANFTLNGVTTTFKETEFAECRIGKSLIDTEILSISAGAGNSKGLLIQLYNFNQKETSHSLKDTSKGQVLFTKDGASNNTYFSYFPSTTSGSTPGSECATSYKIEGDWISGNLSCTNLYNQWGTRSAITSAFSCKLSR